MFVLLFISLVNCDKLLQVQILWRHGARTPLHCNWMCENFTKLDGLNGYLTPTGMRQHYVLGEWLRQKYILNQTFLNPEYDMNQIDIQCTDVNRTIMSAMSNFQGFYPQGNGPLIPNNVDAKYLLPPINEKLNPGDLDQKALPFQMQTVPIHIRIVEDDIYLRGYDEKSCPKNAIIKQQNLETPLYKEINEKAQPTINQFATLMNLDPKQLNISVLHRYQDTFYSCEFNGYPMPELPYSLTEKLKQLSPLTSALENYQNFDQARFMATPFMSNLIKNMDNIITDSDKAFKYHVYSAHDTTVHLILIALNLTSVECMKQVYFKEKVDNPNCQYVYPGYASNIIFELYEKDDKSHYVQILYNGTAIKVCENINCPYEIFKQTLQQQGVQNHEQECQIIEYVTTIPTWLIVMLSILSGFLVIILCFLFLTCFRLKILLIKSNVKNRNRNQAYNKEVEEV